VVNLHYHICKTLPCWPDKSAGHFLNGVQSCLLFVGNASRRCEASIQHHAGVAIAGALGIACQKKISETLAD
jgi:hypothetical protein